MDPLKTIGTSRKDGISALQPPKSSVVDEVDRLLAGRTRDIRLNPELSSIFRLRSWPQTSKIIRAWMIWVVVLDVLTLAVNAILLPSEVVAAMLKPALILPPAALATAAVFLKPRTRWIEGTAIHLGVFLILLSVALVGVAAAGEYYERHLTIMLFVAASAIIIFPVPLEWTISIVLAAIGLFLVLQLQNPHVSQGSALAGTHFFASGVGATVVARRTANILSHKTFLLELRDRARLADLTDANGRLELLARTDALTGIANRRWMMEALHRVGINELEQAEAVAILMCDIDHFKQLNDSLGHAEGDRCLVKVAGIIQSSLRDERDQVARYGGEEFLVLLRGADEQEAAKIAEQIRSRVEAASLPNPRSSVAPYVTVSIGVSILEKGDNIVSSETLQQWADAALYEAKTSGRNRVVTYKP
ncbi:sensor domain-containing diguanylate cyclase [Shinella kummerowiae]|jgi:diguanylate cyclase (GGDEF)-like protein|uniref:GGDEF domain-containing protein n=1 Tax=Shinella kummerowiae TaxID=417745 RepID=UPI0021B5F0F9|nr:GGDEF domain-containing protein [Shinella kummerowiae]MCT7664064.1 GGDEF domain-containing protein [Shinella kummerowiae]